MERKTAFLENYVSFIQLIFIQLELVSIVKKIKLAILVDKPMFLRTFEKEDLDYLRTFADIVNEESIPETVDKEYMKKWLKSAEAAFSCWGTPGFSKEILDCAPGLKVILHAAGTAKAIVTDEIWRRNIRVATAAPVIAIDVAETALGGIIYWLKQFRRFDDIIRRDQWDTKYKVGGESVVNNVKPMMKRLNSRLTVGIVGASFVGKNLIRFLKPFGVNILLYDPYVNAEKAETLGVKLSSLEGIAEQSDVVSIHAPSIPETNNMINRNFFARMRDGSLFVNTSRGSVVNEKDLIDELRRNRIYAYLDVFEKEPLPSESPLSKLENVLLTPHISGGHTTNGGFERGRYIINQLYSYFSLGSLTDEVAEEMMERMA